MPLPFPLIFVICIIGIVVLAIIVESVYTTIKNIIKKRSVIKPPLSSFDENKTNETL
tara:strand:+ start:1314 stop:1484 length:171 start_codon:yes stop_codon:yes gene_type:complete